MQIIYGLPLLTKRQWKRLISVESTCPCSASTGYRLGQIGQMHRSSWHAPFSHLILWKKEKAKISGYHPDGERRFTANYSFLWRVEQVRRTQNVVLSRFLCKMYEKQLKMADFSKFGQTYQFRWLQTIQNHDTLNRYHFNTFQWFLKFRRI